MNDVVRTIIVSASAILMIILQPITLIAMVVAPTCAGIEQQANVYKLVSIGVFSGAYYFLVWRRRSLGAAAAIPAAQILSGWLVLDYINKLPMICPR